MLFRKALVNGLSAGVYSNRINSFYLLTYLSHKSNLFKPKIDWINFFFAFLTTSLGGSFGLTCKGFYKILAKSIIYSNHYVIQWFSRTFVKLCNIRRTVLSYYYKKILFFKTRVFSEKIP